MSDPDDVKAAIAGVELCREIGNSPALGPFVKREVMPGSLTGAELERYVRDAAVSYWHQTCTAKMGQDSMSVVNGELKVYGVEGLRIADGSIMPRVTTGNTMAACVIIGERAADILKSEHTFSCRHMPKCPGAFGVSAYTCRPSKPQPGAFGGSGVVGLVKVVGGHKGYVIVG